MSFAKIEWLAEKIEKSVLLAKILKYLRRWKDWKYFDISILLAVALIFALLLAETIFFGQPT